MAITINMKSHGSTRRSIDREYVATAALLTAALVIGLMTVFDYGITIDEFTSDEYGDKVIAWYLSGFTNRALFSHFDHYLYGPWFQVLTSAVQSLHLGERYETRHVVTFLVGFAGLVALLPIGRLTFGRWTGFTAIALCLLTGNVYGQLFFTPVDVPFMAIMNWATLAIIVMARQNVPTWPATICAGLATGLAIATRAGGVIAHFYLLGAMVLCVLDVIASHDRNRSRNLQKIGIRSAGAILIAWIVAIALWPWLQTIHAASRFMEAFNHFTHITIDVHILHWGKDYHATKLPWSYVPGELFVRLPEGFLALLAAALIFGGIAVYRFAARSAAQASRGRRADFARLALELARARGSLVVVVAALVPIVFIMIRTPTLYNGIRHVMFVIPPLAVLAGWGLAQLAPLIRRFPLSSAIAGSAYVGATIVYLAMLHPLEYVATNVFGGWTRGSAGRFELDYWAAAATPALRRLEQRVSYDKRFAARTPSIAICFPSRDYFVRPMYRRPWVFQPDPKKADFIIQTETVAYTYCSAGVNGDIIDEVKRFGVTFAKTFENPTPVQ